MANHIEDPEIRAIFLEAAEIQTEALKKALYRLYQQPQDRQAAEAVHIAAHTLKGDAGFVQLADIAQRAGEIEQAIRAATHGQAGMTQNQVITMARTLDTILQQVVSLENDK
jgi:chemotaxis protein histidine kinase CheA